MILPDKKACYAIFKAHDARFDGKMFVGVASTGIYCRPVCRVKTPKPENCTYYLSAAAAQAAGFRPCLKCRPELAPGLSPADASQRLGKKAALIMEEDFLSDINIAGLAHKLGITGRHLGRIFISQFGVPPVQYLQTQKLLLAKQLLTDTNISVADAALTSGFGSVRRFNALFKSIYNFTPTQLRGKKTAAAATSGITLRLGYRPPYAWDKILAFLKTRAIVGIEAVEGNIYRRTAAIKSGDKYIYGWLSVTNEPKKNLLIVTLSSSLLPVLPKVLMRIKSLFDLDCEPMEIFEKLSVMNKISKGLCVAGLRLPGAFDPFETAVYAVLGQQITLKAAKTLASRVAQKLGEKNDTPFKDLTHSFPSPDKICGLKVPVENVLGPMGIIKTRAKTIFALAQALSDNTINFSKYADIYEETEKLLKLPGIGPWTANYIAMRSYGWPDAFPHTDYGVKKALGSMTEKEILKLAENWRPWRSYAVMNLWNFL